MNTGILLQPSLRTQTYFRLSLEQKRNDVFSKLECLFIPLSLFFAHNIYLHFINFKLKSIVVCLFRLLSTMQEIKQ